MSISNKLQLPKSAQFLVKTRSNLFITVTKESFCSSEFFVKTFKEIQRNTFDNFLISQTSFFFFDDNYLPNSCFFLKHAGSFVRLAIKQFLHLELMLFLLDTLLSFTSFFQGSTIICSPNGIASGFTSSNASHRADNCRYFRFIKG